MRALDELGKCKGQFGREAAGRTARLLERLTRTRVREPAELIRLHEIVLFLRAYPQSARVVRLADGILFSFAERMRGVDAAAFDDPEVAGIAGTVLSTNFGFEFASFLKREGAIDWENYEHSDRLGAVAERAIPGAFEEWAVEPHVDWKAWFERAGWDVARVLKESGEPRIYDLLELPLRWDLGRSRGASRSELRLPGPEIFYHSGEFLRRRDVSIEAAFAEPAIAARRVARARAREVLRVVRLASASRYRELYGFQHAGDEIYHANLGRGVDFYFFGVAKDWRLPVRDYHAGMFFKNGVPMGYVETLTAEGRCEVGGGVGG
jgi:hypothetical protein